MREAHTGEHILFRALSTVFPGITVKKVEFGKRNYFRVSYDGHIDWGTILKAEIIANDIIAKGRPVRKIKGTREEIEPLFPQLRVRWDRITDETITVVEVEGFDWAACVGEHVKNTKDVSYIMVTRIVSMGKKEYEIEFEVGEKAKREALKRSALFMEVSSLLRTSLDEVIPTVRNLKENEETLAESVCLLTKALTEKMKSEIIQGISVYVEDISGADHKTAERAASDLVSTGKALVILVEQVDRAFVVMTRSPSLSVDLRELLTFIPDGKGGGSPEHVVASSPQKVDIRELREKIQRFLSEIQ